MTRFHDALVRRVLGPAGPELTCEQCFEEIDRYTDVEHSGADAEAAVPGMTAHLDGCPACAEEHATLRALLGAKTRRHLASDSSGGAQAD